MVKPALKLSLFTVLQVKGIYLQPELFSIEDGLLTPTMKTKRAAIEKSFKDELEKLYEEIDGKLHK